APSRNASARRDSRSHDRSADSANQPATLPVPFGHCAGNQTQGPPCRPERWALVAERRRPVSTDSLEHGSPHPRRRCRKPPSQLADLQECAPASPFLHGALSFLFAFHRDTWVRGVV